MTLLVWLLRKLRDRRCARGEHRYVYGTIWTPGSDVPGYISWCEHCGHVVRDIAIEHL